MVISIDGLMVDPAKIQTLPDWQVPRTVKDVLSFLEFASFYRMVFAGLGTIAYPSTELTKGKNCAFERTDRCWEAFEKFKTAFTTAPVLEHYDPEAESWVEVDA